MIFDHISVPEIYTTSADFRFFLKWFKTTLSKVQYDTENLADIYDPLKCPAELLWMLADTMGFKYDDRLPTSFNRLVLLYFMSMIRNRGSKDGITIAAEVNLAQHNLLQYGEDEGNIYYNRLEDTSIPVNSVYVTPHVEEGYIDIVYFSDTIPIDACIEYVRPVGMWLKEHAGVRFDGKTKVSVDPRLTDANDASLSIGSTRVGHYSRKDYASLQKTKLSGNHHVEVTSHSRDKVYERNSEVESRASIDAGYRALYSLQLCNSEHIFKSLFKKIFGLGLNPLTDTDVVIDSDKQVLPDIGDGVKSYNLRYDKTEENKAGNDVYTTETGSTITNPIPKVNPIMQTIGEAMYVNGKRVVIGEDGRPKLEE